MKPEFKAQNPKFKILLVENNPGDADLIREILEEQGTNQFQITHVERLNQAIRCLREDGFDTILLDLLLPDATGIDTFLRLVTLVPEVPIIVLTGLNNEYLASCVLQNGAQDYMIKGQIDGNLLVRSIRYAIERHRAQMALRSPSLIDDLTNLYNRRGFLNLAEHQLKLARRTKRGLLLIFADLDDLKQINDTFGHKEGDFALIESANILKETFRSSDIIARIGGDEFVALALETSEANVEVIYTRLQSNLDVHNIGSNRPYTLSISIGIAYYNPESSHTIDELLTRADKLMYEQKIHKKIKVINREEPIRINQ
ncbi:MAG TPA: GGDEF domain-containing response regulator [Thermodesulfobacteriota bacterium]|nr:GGDEF domain-containing response regulator [Thermodesulfobacteriota bacterium]